MKSTRAVIIEDERRSADELQFLINTHCPAIEVVGHANSVKTAISCIEKYKPGLAFLDIELPDGNGFNILESFPRDHFNFIFVTAFERYAIKAIRSCALDYLLKPIDVDELTSAVARVSHNAEIPGMESRKEIFFQNSRQPDFYRRKIALPTREGLLFINQDDIIYCEAENNYTNFITKSKENILVSKPLSYFEGILDEEFFCRSHHSYLVNLNYIKKYVKGRGGYLVMSNGSKVDVSERMKMRLLEKFNR